MPRRTVENLGYKRVDFVVINGMGRQIKFGEVIQPTDEYEIRLYTFEDQWGEESDGCLFVIKPGCSTRVVKITDPEFTTSQIAIEGSGWLLAINPEGETFSQEVGEKAEENPLMEIGQGWTYCWVANPYETEKELKVLTLNNPPFNPNVEVIIDVDSEECPLEFWSSRDLLRG